MVKMSYFIVMYRYHDWLIFSRNPFKYYFFNDFNIIFLNISTS